MDKPLFSLIVATKGRTKELAEFIATAADQKQVAHELIVMDQNDDGRLENIVEAAARQGSRIRHLRCSTGVSRARNLGLRVAIGEIIAFPDDDCWYPPGILQQVSDWFNAHPGYDILTVTSRDAHGERSGNRWHRLSCDLTPMNIFRTSVCYCCFLRGTEQVRQLRFDPCLGPGGDSPYPASEDTDFILSALSNGVRGRFEAKWYVGHPRKDVRNGSITPERAYQYGLGMGRVQGKHRLMALWAGFVLYDVARAALMAALGRRDPATLWFAHGRGLAKAYFAR